MENKFITPKILNKEKIAAAAGVDIKKFKTLVKGKDMWIINPDLTAEELNKLKEQLQ